MLPDDEKTMRLISTIVFGGVATITAARDRCLL